jgi:HMG (high mobility group) box
MISPSFSFVREKSEYKGPWVVPKRRAKKHPLAPKRPMSAFLKFSQKRRSMVKERNPDMSNTDVSRLLGEMWRNASAAERAPYVEQEERERAAYKAEIQTWREEQAKLDASTRTSHLEVVMDGADEKQSSIPVQEQQAPQQQQHQHHHLSRDAYGDPANSFASYEPISLHGADEAAPYMRSLAPREVFRSYSSGSSSYRAHSSSQPRPVDEQRTRSDAANIYSYRFGGMYSPHEHEMYYPPPRNYRGTPRPPPSSI